jgi:hypothetical protein
VGTANENLHTIAFSIVDKNPRPASTGAGWENTQSEPGTVATWFFDCQFPIAESQLAVTKRIMTNPHWQLAITMR